MLNIIYIAGGGAVGALLRYWVSHAIHSVFGRDFPHGTLTVNVIGSLLIGILFVISTDRVEDSLELRAGLMIGLLGAFTTFSTFSLETLMLIQSGEQIKAVINITLSVLLCLLGCWAGMLLARLAWLP